jgi:uncharacterized protein RhaS with RHS repeats
MKTHEKTIMKSNIKRLILVWTTIFAGLVQVANAFYDPGLQRWINRDPIGEQGGINLFEFNDNDSVGMVDLFGHESCGFDPNDDGARNSGRPGHKKKRNTDTHTNAETHGGKKSKPNMAGTPPTAAQKEQIKAEKIKKGEIPNPNNKMGNKGPKKKTGGFANTKLLDKIALVGAEAACAIAYNNCLDDAEKTNDSDLEQAMRGRTCEGRQAAIDNAMDIYYISAAQCAASYAICGLAGLLPF